MKIQIIALNREYKPKYANMRWHRLPLLFEKLGHDVDQVLIQDWKKFYIRYLKFKPDVIISVGIVGFLPAIIKKLKLINSPIIHDWTDDYTDIMGKKYGIDRVAFLEHFIIKNSDLITTPSKYLQKKCDLFGKDAVYIPHGVNTDFIKGQPKKLPGKMKVLYVGSQSDNKLANKILDSVDGLDCDLYLVGKINENLRSKAAKNTHFIGEVKHTEVPKYIRAADIMIFAADDDSTLKMFEYLKAGKPIVTLKGRPGYVLDNNVNALLVDNLQEGLKKLIADEKLRKKLAQNAKKFKIYTWEEIAKMYLKFLETVVKK
jgi:glycosyltransferase involved in cell wall biosynthesis